MDSAPRTDYGQEL
ncbi:hypothetical protein E2C01_081618 [Portunus trituberculatus]|uniref:Uncharacterized protein n=1 Tax=Portunus trituberculatus TaxID=210409 RepID=A0A5B7ISC8_PORTR|nr:hypothetical protein [Portunus trituberculatus]